MFKNFFKSRSIPKRKRVKRETEVDLQKITLEIKCTGGETFYEEFTGYTYDQEPDIYIYHQSYITATEMVNKFITDFNVYVKYEHKETQTTYYNLKMYSTKIIKQEVVKGTLTYSVFEEES